MADPGSPHGSAAGVVRLPIRERGREVVTRHAVQPGGDRIEFLTANRQQLEELRAAVRPLSRKLATRLAARRHRARRGRIDIRRTLRRSMGTGGIPIRPAYAKPHPARPELVLLCDVSGSVRYRYKDGTNPWWTAVQVLNHALPITSLEWSSDGSSFKAAPRQDYNYFLDAAGFGENPVTVRITAVDGQTLTDTLPGPAELLVVDGETQFE